MLNATIELFMSEYFLIKAVLGKYLENDEEAFRALAGIFLIPESKITELFRLSENDTAKAITTDKEFMQHKRMQKYSQLIGSVTAENGEWEEVAGIKGNAILTAQSHKLVVNEEASRNIVYTCLSSAVNCGLVSAMRITGILQCEGIFLGKNQKQGVKTLSKAAGWNDVVSTLALLHYCRDGRRRNMARLRVEVADTPFWELYVNAVKQYGEADSAEIGEAALLEKSFGSGVLKREIYDPKYARILNSPALYIKDKEKVVFSLNKELVCAISDLPLKLSREKNVGVDLSALQNTALKRKDEAAAISRALGNCDLRESESYRPLCLCCGSEYVLNMYARAIGADDAKVHVEIIDVAELGEYDLEPTPNNIFVRSVDEDRDNRFLLFFYGDIPERKIEAVRSVLQSGRRSKFRLVSPGVTLNLGAVLPVCFCDEQNAKRLGAYCDQINLGEVTAEELSAAVGDILGSKQKLYGVGEIEICGEPADVFRGYGIDTAEKLIDAAVRTHRQRGAKITLSRELLQEYAGDNDKNIIGFGGGRYGRYQKHS